MGKYNSNKLLSLAGLFETKANCFASDRFWALTVLAQANVGPDLPDRFKRALGILINANPTDEEWKNWYEANKTVLADFPTKHWNTEYKHIWTQLTYGSEEVLAFIALNSQPPSNNFEASSVSILRASGSIPPLWLQVGKYIRGFDPQNVLEPGLAHEEWLVHGLKVLMYRATPEQIKNFLKDNKKTIDRIRKSFYTSNPKYLGGGADGATFDIGEGRVLKLFRDETSYEKALEAFHRLHGKHPTAKTEAMIYDVGILGDFLKYPDDPDSSVPIYYYIMEKMRTLMSFYKDWYNIPLAKILSATAEDIYRNKETKWNKLKNLFDDPSKGRLIRQIVRDEARKLAVHMRHKPELRKAIEQMKQDVPSLKENWLELYIEEVMIKYLTGRTDLHMGNIGVTGYGELRYYDPTYGKRPYINI